MRSPLLLLPSLVGSIWASPTPSPFDADPSLVELGRRAAAAGQPTITATQCYVKVKADPGFVIAKPFEVQGTLWLVQGIPSPAGSNKPWDLILRGQGALCGAGELKGPVSCAGSPGGLQFMTNGYLNGFPNLKPGPIVDYVQFSGNAAKFTSTIDNTKVPYYQQPQRFTEAMQLDPHQIGNYNPAMTYPITDGWFGLTVTTTGKDTKDVSGITWFQWSDSQRGLYVAYVTGSCFGNVTLPLTVS
ncbi:hypothetical protein NW759_005175 [Fusarium solani]|uniref:Uncharacterized protein n=1 Tax=Fusarium solani TaxID=169388 RepID=A0A9P9L6S6_FUSSL|nr:uncharacterized protein B0J15DRAFT_557217 [Fusarium solani]KAH7275263.1 hypothetical protein B0J15DRAFT_557217 [Fusarium solani]KAJ4225481.1 hypothetical protein NW759_005175 [Fusarium solani]